MLCFWQIDILSLAPSSVIGCFGLGPEGLCDSQLVLHQRVEGRRSVEINCWAVSWNVWECAPAGSSSSKSVTFLPRDLVAFCDNAWVRGQGWHLLGRLSVSCFLIFLVLVTAPQFFFGEPKVRWIHRKQMVWLELVLPLNSKGSCMTQAWPDSPWTAIQEWACDPN